MSRPVPVCPAFLSAEREGPVRPIELKKRGQSTSAFGVRGVWQRHDLENIKKRL
jgi:hypothetical protein